MDQSCHKYDMIKQSLTEIQARVNRSKVTFSLTDRGYLRFLPQAAKVEHGSAYDYLYSMEAELFISKCYMEWKVSKCFKAETRLR